MLTDLCPDRQQLRDFVTGRLPELSLDAIAEHLETCDECESDIATLDSESDSFIDELKCPACDESFINEYEFHEAVSVVQAYEGDAPKLTKWSSKNQHLGQYMLVERLGAGGMGTVYKALHTKLEKIVALKLLRTKRMLDDRAIARFEREMKAVGGLKHENIVQASDAGDADGKQYLVMEYIEGAEFSELIARNERLSIADACELVRQAAVGLQHAHEHGLIHRDVKPSNLMLAVDGCVKILDLGLAGCAGEQFTRAIACNTHTECDDLTLDGQIMGTAEYIAPEQAENSRDVDTRADIYGLGCTLYALLAGVPPFQRQDFVSPKQLIKAHQTSNRPSIANLPPELARIIDRMLAIDPSDRFSTPGEVAVALSPFTINADIGSLLSSAPKSTHDESVVRWGSDPDEKRLWKPSLQKKVLVVLAMLAVMSFGAFGIVFNLKTPYGTAEIETDDENVEISVSQAGKRIRISETIGKFNKSPFPFMIGADPGGKGEPTQFLNGFIDEVRVSNTAHYTGDFQPPSELASEKDTLVLYRFDEGEGDVANDASENRLHGKIHNEKWVAAKAALKAVESAAIQRLRQIGVAITERSGVATSFGIGNSAKITDADLAMLESLRSLENFTLVRCDNVTDAGFTHLKYLPRLQTLNLSPSNITDAGLAHVKGMKDLWRLSLNSTRISDVGMVHLTHLSSLKHLILSNTQVTAAGLTHLATLKHLKVLQLINTQITPTEVEELRQLLPKDCEIQHSVVAPQETLPIEVLTSTTLSGHENHVNSAVFSPDGKTLVAADYAGTVILWDLSTQAKLRLLNNIQPIECAVFSPDGKSLVTADRGSAITCWDVETGRVLKKIKEHNSAVMSVAYSPEGDMLASAGVDKIVRIWDSATGKVRATLSGHQNAIQEVTFSPDGKTMASVDLDGTLNIWDPIEGELLRTYQVDRSGMGLAFSPNGKVLATANYPPKIQLWDVATGKVLETLMGHKSRVRDVAFSPNGRVLASAGDDQTIRLWDIASRRQIGILSGHTGRVHDVEFSPDGKTLASASADKTSKVWNVESLTSGK